MLRNDLDYYKVFYLVCRGGHIVYLDREGFNKCYQFKWCATKNGNIRYAMRKDSTGKTLYLHHFLFGKGKNGKVIDHKNGDGLDNRKENIRMVNRFVNALNTGRTKGYYKKGNVFIARAWVNNKNIYFGRYKTELEAKKVVMDFKEKLL